MPKNIEFNFESLNICNRNEVKMYRLPVYKVMLVKEHNQTTPVSVIRTPENVYQIANEYLAGLDREHFVVIMLNTKNKVIGINTAFIGTLNSCPVHPREIFKPAIIIGAAGIILVHNHPSGDSCESNDDILLTRRLREAGEIIGIPIVDHIIIGENCYTSLKIKGLL